MSADQRKLVVTLALGKDRNYIHLTKNLMEDYAKKVGADFLIVDDTNVSILETYPSDFSVGREGGKAYIYKKYLLYHYLDQYDRILYLDDTCCVHPQIEDLFEKVPFDCIGAYCEGKRFELRSHQYDKKLIKNLKGFDLIRERYFNSGVTLVSRVHRDIFSPEMIQKHGDLFQSLYPSQAYLNYVVQLAKVPVFDFGPKYNNFTLDPNWSYGFFRGLENLDPEFIQNPAIYHVTGYYLNRKSLIEQCVQILMEIRQKTINNV